MSRDLLVLGGDGFWESIVRCLIVRGKEMRGYERGCKGGSGEDKVEGTACRFRMMTGMAMRE